MDSQWVVELAFTSSSGSVRGKSTQRPMRWILAKLRLHHSPLRRWKRSLDHSAPVEFSSVAQSCPTLCKPVNRSMPGLPVHHQLPEFTQIHIHRSRWCHPAISSSVVPFSPAPKPSHHQGLFQWVNSSHEVAKVLEFQLWHHSFQRTPRTDRLYFLFL